MQYILSLRAEHSSIYNFILDTAGRLQRGQGNTHPAKFKQGKKNKIIKNRIRKQC